MILLDGQALAQRLLQQFQPKLSGKTIAIVQVGSHLPSTKYIELKTKKAAEIGVLVQHMQLENPRPGKIQSTIQALNDDPSINGIMVQLPIPGAGAEETRAILDTIHPAKDVDCLTSTRLGYTWTNTDSLLPATSQGIITLLAEYEIEYKSKVVVLVGASLLVNKPLINYFETRGATVVVCNELTPDLAQLTVLGDIVIAAAGVPKLITATHIKPGAVVVDVGWTVVKGKGYGDVEFGSVSTKAGYVTPVPGGVGPMTIASLLINLTRLSHEQ